MRVRTFRCPRFDAVIQSNSTCRYPRTGEAGGGACMERLRRRGAGDHRGAAMKLTVKTLSGTRFEIRVQHNDTVRFPTARAFPSFSFKFPRLFLVSFKHRARVLRWMHSFTAILCQKFSSISINADHVTVN